MKEHVSWMNLGKIFVANILNAIFGMIDILFYILSAFVVVTGLRYIHFKKEYIIMKHKYDKFDTDMIEKRKKMKLKRQESKNKMSLARQNSVALQAQGLQYKSCGEIFYLYLPVFIGCQ